jgi:hypothetical protein
MAVAAEAVTAEEAAVLATAGQRAVAEGVAALKLNPAAHVAADE